MSAWRGTSTMDERTGDGMKQHVRPSDRAKQLNQEKIQRAKEEKKAQREKAAKKAQRAKDAKKGKQR